MPLLVGFLVGGLLFCPKMLLALAPIVLVGMIVGNSN